METELVLLGLDDTDSPDRGRTGSLARELAGLLARETGGVLTGVTRHRLLQDPRVPCTRKNQASCIGLRLPRGASPSLLPLVRQEVLRRAVPGSDPGICVATGSDLTPAVMRFGQRVKTALVSRGEAHGLAADESLVLEELGGTGDGVIGALAAVGLRSSGNDGRFTLLQGIREMAGLLPVSSLVSSGAIARVCDWAGARLPSSALVDTGGKVRPWLRGGEAVLVVEPDGAGNWRPVRGGL